MKSFEQEVWRHYSRIKHFALRFVKNNEDAEDIAQETLLAAITQQESFRGDSLLSTWLLSIARFKAFTFLRKKRHTHEVGGESYDNALQNLYVNPNQHDALELTEVLKMIQALPDEQRNAIIQTRVFGHSGIDVAADVDIAVNTVKTRVFYGAKKLGGGYTKTQRTKTVKKSPLRYRQTAIQDDRPPVYPVRQLGPESQAWKAVQEKLGTVSTKPLVVQGELQAFGMMFTLHKVVILPDGQEQKIYRAA